jgi:hypothetical protein
MIDVIPRQEILTRNELEILAETTEKFCISIYMPTSWIGADMQQNHIRFKNLLRSAQDQLEDNGMRAQDVQEMLAPGYALQKNSPFWREQNTGLATFISKNLFRYYRLPLELPEVISVKDRFHLQPLLPLFSSSGRYYLLSVSKKAVHFYQGMRNCIIELEPKNLPKKLDDTIKFDVTERQNRNRPGARAGATSLFHGHGSWQDETKDQVVRYLNDIDRSIQTFLKEEQAPIVFAGVDYIFAYYRDLTSNPNLLSEAIIGNPDAQRPDELSKAAWDIVQPYYHKTLDAALAQYRQSAGTGLTSTDLKEIVPACYQGRTGILFAASGQRKWGTFVPESNEITLHQREEKGSEDLCDLAAIYTFLNKGVVYELQPQEMPDRALVAAIFRY